ncbi:MAG: site-specific integrase [Syntrophobacteraceae bacterium]
MEGTGSVYLRGKTWWLKYYKNGKPFYESAKTDKKMVAKRLLAKRTGEIAEGKIPGILFEKVKFDDLAEEFLTDYRINAKKSLERAEISTEHLKKCFEGVRVPEITTAEIKKYIEKRMEEGASNSTINRELAALKRMLNLGAKCTPPKVDRVPYIPMLKEGNARKGFFEHAKFIAVRDALPSYLKGVVTFGYKTGWRKSEVTELQWSQVDLENGIVCLNPGETKNDDARTVYLDEELKELFEAQWKARKESGKLTPYVFPNEGGMDSIKSFRGSWDTACTSVGVPGKLFHDLRRTAVRNMVRAGIPERVAMMISGHQTRSVFERYNIVDSEDLKKAACRQEQYLNGQKTEMVTKTVTTGNFGKKKKSVI